MKNIDLQNEIDKIKAYLDGKINNAKKQWDFAIHVFRFGLATLAIILATLALIITLQIVFFGFLGLTSWNDIQKIKQMSKTVDDIENQIEKVNKLFKEASLMQIIPLISLDFLEWGEKTLIYKPYYQIFQKLDSYEQLNIIGEFRSSIEGDTAYFTFFTTDDIDTLRSAEIKTSSKDLMHFDTNIDISKLQNGTCKYAFSAKTMGKNKAIL